MGLFAFYGAKTAAPRVSALLRRCAISSQGQRRTRENRFEAALAICGGVSRKRVELSGTTLISVDISKAAWYVALLEGGDLAAEI